MRSEHRRHRLRLRSRAARPSGSPLALQFGLTLVELLIAISVLAIVAVLGWRGLDAIVRARVSLTEELEQTRGLQLSFAQMQNDCAQIASSTLLLNRVPLRIDQGRLTLVRTVQTDAQPLRVQVVSYQLRGNVLVRQESPATRDLLELDNHWRNAASGVEAGYAVSLQKNVSSLAIRLWASDDKGWRSADVGADVGADSPAGATSGVSPANPGAASVSGKGQVITQGLASARTPVNYSGLEMTLRLAGREAPMQKVLLLGAT